MAHRYYVVYQFEKNGMGGTGATDSVVFTSDPPASRDVAGIAEAIRAQCEYDQVLILHWHKLSNVVDLTSIQDTSEDVQPEESAEESETP